MANPNTAVFPGRVPTDNDLFVATNTFQTTLTTGIGSGDLSMTLNSVVGLLTPGLLRLGNEFVFVASLAGNVATITRAADGTSPIGAAASHAAGIPVYGYVMRGYHNQMAAEVKAICAQLGQGLSFTRKSSRMTAYQFTLTPGGSLAVGSNTVTFTTAMPVPRGVNGADAAHYIYISGGTGTAEAVLITGGTAVAEGTSGTITFTCANTHSGAFTITSATAGMQEAINTAAEYTEISIPAAIHQFYAAAKSTKFITFNGEGGTSILYQNNLSSGTLICDTAATNFYTRIANFTILSASQQIAGTALTLVNQTDGIVENIRIGNAYDGMSVTGSPRLNVVHTRVIAARYAHYIDPGLYHSAGTYAHNYVASTTGGSTIAFYINGVSASGAVNAGLTIFGPYIEAGAGEILHGVYMNFSSICTGSEVILRGGIYDGIKSYAVTTAGSAPGTNNLIIEGIRVNNVPTGLGGILLQVPMANVTILNNVINTYADGIVLSGISGSHISGNRVIANPGASASRALVLAVGAGGVLTSNNIFSNNSFAVPWDGTVTPIAAAAVATDASAGANNYFLHNNYYAPVGMSFTGGNNRFEGGYGIDTATTSIAAAASITLPPGAKFVTITGNSAAIATVVGGYKDREVFLHFTDGAPAGITTGGNFRIGTAIGQYQTAHYVFDGTYWV